MKITLAILALLSSAFALTPNLQDNLLPPEGAVWRGSTMQTLDGNYDPMTHEDEFGVPLHMLRIFQNKKPWQQQGSLSENELKFVKNGGIVYFTFQVKKYSEATDPTTKNRFERKIRRYAKAFKQVAPAKMYIAPGFEQNAHVNKNDWSVKNGKYWGTAEEYKAMYREVHNIFKDEGVTNAIWTVDYSPHAYKNDGQGFVKTYPGDEYVDWIFFNTFQSKKTDKCDEMVLSQYHALMDNSNEEHNFMSKPWGLGAFGAKYTYKSDDGLKIMPACHRRKCLNGVKKLQENGKINRIKAMVHFNSLESVIRPPYDPINKIKSTLASDKRIFKAFTDYNNMEGFENADIAIRTMKESNTNQESEDEEETIDFGDLDEEDQEAILDGMDEEEYEENEEEDDDEEEVEFQDMEALGEEGEPFGN